MGTSLTPQEASALAATLAKINKSYIDAGKSAQLLYNATKNTAAAAKGEAAIRVEVLKSYQTEYATLQKLAKINMDQYKTEKARLQILVDMDVRLEKQEAILENINKLNEKNKKVQEQEIDIMKKKGQMARAYFSEVAMNARRSFQTESGHTNATSVVHGSANAAVAAHGVANDPGAALNNMGPYGMILKIIADVIDGARLMGAALHSASAEAGGFADSFGTAAREAINITSQQTNLMTEYGMTTEEVSNVYKELKGTGLAALGVIPQTGDAMSALALDTISFAKASNQATAQVSAQMAALVRTNGMAKEKLSGAYDKIFSAADRMAKKGLASMSEIVQATFSMNESFKEMGMNVGGISNIIEGVGDALKKLGRPGGIDMITKVADGILGLSKASEGWQVLMGKMSGMSGGFLQTLFTTQQRGANMMNPQANEYDPMKNIAMFKSMISKTANRAPDPRMRQFLTEKMGGQMGMDTGTVQVMQQMMSGKMSQNKAVIEMKKLHEAAKENNMSSKGMFDILRNILIGMIAKPLMYIWKWTAKGSDKAEAERMTNMVNQAGKQSNEPLKKEGRNAAGIMGQSLESDVTRTAALRTGASQAAAGQMANNKPANIHVIVSHDKSGAVNVKAVSKTEAVKVTQQNNKAMHGHR